MELAPRLEARPADDQRVGEWASKMCRDQLAESQRAALDNERPFSGLMDDYLSPDLQAVVENIARDRVPAARQRARQLINAMDRSWKDLYAGREDAVAVDAYYMMNRQAKSRRLGGLWSRRPPG